MGRVCLGREIAWIIVSFQTYLELIKRYILTDLC